MERGTGGDERGRRGAGRTGASAPGGAPQATMLQRRQRQLDAFIKVLQERLSAAGA